MSQRGTQSICMGTTHPSTRGRAGASHGFTLVELMITIFVAAILIAIAVPSFQHIIASSKLASTANTLVSSLHAARMQAIKRNADVQFCSNDAGINTDSALGTQCASQGGAVYMLTTPGGADTPVQVRTAASIAQGQQQLDGDITALVFDPQGLAHEPGQDGPYSGDVADICTSVMDADNHRVVKMVTGSIIHVTTETGACP